MSHQLRQLAKKSAGRKRENHREPAGAALRNWETRQRACRIVSGKTWRKFLVILLLPVSSVGDNHCNAPGGKNSEPRKGGWKRRILETRCSGRGWVGGDRPGEGELLRDRGSRMKKIFFSGGGRTTSNGAPETLFRRVGKGNPPSTASSITDSYLFPNTGKNQSKGRNYSPQKRLQKREGWGAGLGRARDRHRRYPKTAVVSPKGGETHPTSPVPTRQG